MSKICDTVTKLAQPVIAELGLELWDVEFVREGGVQVLRVIIDREGGISTEDCEAVSRALDPLLDEADPVPSGYTFEVSSAGIERPLKRPSDFERFMGSLVEVRFYKPRDGAREMVGTLSHYGGGEVGIETDGRVVRFPLSEVALVRLHYQW